MTLNHTAQRMRSRLLDPGILYNLGNTLGFVVGLGVALSADVSSDDGATAWDQAVAHIVGSPAATALTAATCVFFWGGMVYTKAWSNGAPPEPKLNRQGDMLSGLGAILLGIGLIMVGDLWLAASAGVLHAAGKFGSALGGTITWRRSRIQTRLPDLCKDLVLVSRAPAVLVGASAFWREVVLLESTPGLLLSLSFMACCLIWAAADWMLLSPEGWIKTAATRLSGRNKLEI
ncbi:hypothetical protein [Aminobacter sp. AP02]|uniref:hypothetical protein n=1 Tax=Aminobacter sp. AP02 TaxID=2135737 RepID=UPI000D7A2FCC|nr:hypothetical protein [Aminobacter sp. AP02]PWK64649.1 hypothetical protein C8K44_11990 [Aminobacter sp. AP02]